jgi:hypothetical protein
MQLAATAKGVDDVLPLHDRPPPVGFDTHIEIMEFGHVLRIEPEDLPGQIPYLFTRNVSNVTLPRAALRVGSHLERRGLCPPALPAGMVVL